MDEKELAGKLHWLGHDSFRLDGPPVIYFDPVKLQGDQPKADLVLVSHEHYDHCSPDDVKRISGRNTVVLAGGAAAKKLRRARKVKPGDRVSVPGVEVEAVPAYNINKFRSPGVLFHPREAGNVGFVVSVGGVRFYHAGDADLIPEMADLECDVALLPVSGTYVMTVEEAAEAARTIRPQVVVPMHFGSGIGAANDGLRLAELYDGQVLLLPAE